VVNPPQAMRKKIALICLAVISLSATPLFFASQAGKLHNEADKELNAVYSKVLASIHDPHERELLVEAQRAWIKFRDADAAFDGEINPVGKGGLFHSTNLTNDRIAYLKNLLGNPKEEH
jgi:uncharacterized protein YecT (DUF1311 family)